MVHTGGSYMAMVRYNDRKRAQEALVDSSCMPTANSFGPFRQRMVRQPIDGPVDFKSATQNLLAQKKSPLPECPIMSDDEFLDIAFRPHPKTLYDHFFNLHYAWQQVRVVAKKIVIHPYFDRFILFVITFNSLLMALTNYKHVDSSNNIVEQGSTINLVPLYHSSIHVPPSNLLLL